VAAPNAPAVPAHPSPYNIPGAQRNLRTMAGKDHRGLAGLSMGGGQTAAITMVNLDKFSYVGLFHGGAATGGGGRGRGGAARGGATGATPVAPAPAAAAGPFDLKTIHSGAMADPAEFDNKGKGPLHEFRDGPPDRESRSLEETPGTTDRRRDRQQLRLHLSRHHARMADLAKEPLYFFAQLLFK
jgi:hypothetical protein